MSSSIGVVGGGHLGEQIKLAKGTDGAGATLTTNVIPPAVQTGTVTSAGVDTLGFGVALANFNVGAIGSAGNYTVKVQTSADDGVADAYADLASSTQGDTAFSVATAAGALATANTDVTLLTDLRGAKRYIRYIGTLVSGTSVLFGASVVLGGGEVLPVSAN